MDKQSIATRKNNVETSIKLQIGGEFNNLADQEVEDIANGHVLSH